MIIRTSPLVDRSRQRSFPTRVLAGLLACVFILLLTGCRAPDDPGLFTPSRDDTLYVEPENGDYLNEVEFLRMIVLAMQNEDHINTLWNHIPPRQRSEISLSQFVQYIRFLNRALQGPVASFERAPAEVQETVKRRVMRDIPPEIQADGGYWLLQTDDPEAEITEFGLFLTCDEHGMPYFSSVWIDKIAYLYDYVRLYFDAIERQNDEAMLSLRRQGKPPEQARDAVERERTARLMDFYNMLGRNVVRHYHFVELLPGQAVIEQTNLPRIAGIDNSRRRVVFRETDGQVEIVERLPETLDAKDRIVMRDDRLLFRLMDRDTAVTSDDLIEALGIPLNFEAIPLSESGEEPAPDGTGYFRLTWPGLILEAHGNYNIEEVRFSGYVTRADLYYSELETASGLCVGAPVDTLYLHYPFARENEYLISSLHSKDKITMAVRIEAGHITRLSLISDNAR